MPPGESVRQTKYNPGLWQEMRGGMFEEEVRDREVHSFLILLSLAVAAGDTRNFEQHQRVHKTNNFLLFS